MGRVVVVIPFIISRRYNLRMEPITIRIVLPDGQCAHEVPVNLWDGSGVRLQTDDRGHLIVGHGMNTIRPPYAIQIGRSAAKPVVAGQ